MNPYKPFHEEKNRRRPVLWQLIIILLCVLLLLFGLNRLENRIIITEDGISLRASSSQTEEESEPEFIWVPDLVMEETEDTERDTQEKNDEKDTDTESSETEVTSPEEEAGQDTEIVPEDDRLWAEILAPEQQVVPLSSGKADAVILPLHTPSGSQAYDDLESAASRVEELRKEGYLVYGSFTVYADDAFCENNPASVLKSQTMDSGWIDDEGNHWINPYSKVFDESFTTLLEGYASLDLDGYVVENATFPVYGDLDDTKYVNDTSSLRASEVKSTLSSILSALEGKKIYYVLSPAVLKGGEVAEKAGMDPDWLKEAGVKVILEAKVSGEGTISRKLSPSGSLRELSLEEITEFAELAENRLGSLCFYSLSLFEELEETETTTALCNAAASLSEEQAGGFIFRFS